MNVTTKKKEPIRKKLSKNIKKQAPMYMYRTFWILYICAQMLRLKAFSHIQNV